MMIKVTLRKRLKADGMYHFYLDFYPPYFNPKTRTTKRQVFLKETEYPHPSTPQQKKHNKENYEMAMAIRDKTSMDIRNKELGLFNDDVLLGDFVDYFYKYTINRNPKSRGAYLQFYDYVHGKCRFLDITEELCNGFKDYLLNVAKQKKRGQEKDALHHNTAAAYYIQFICVLNAAFKDKLLKVKITDYLDAIKTKATHRPYLTMAEAMQLHNTPCRYEVLKRASFFSILTGLRISDILDLKWEDIKIAPDGGPCIIKVIQKTQEEKIVYINEEALSYCGTPYESGPVFYGLRKEMTHKPLKAWLKAAGIEKDFSFHCFRHTFATLQLLGGIDIYTVSHQLTHACLSTTQIYVSLVDKKGRESANAISFLPRHDEPDEQ